MAPILLREDSLTYDTIVERLQKQLKSQKSALVARYEFDNRARNAGETVSQYVAVLKHLGKDCKFNDAMRLERLRVRLVSGIRDKRMMSELLKLKIEELTFDIAVAKCIATEQSYKDVKALQGVKSQTQSICYPSQGQARSLKLRKKLSFQIKRASHPLKSRVIKVATAVWEIMIIKVVRSKRKNVTTVTRPAILKGLVNPRKGRHKLPDHR